MNNREVMQQAMEALEELNGLDTETECVTIDVGDVIAALKAALEQQAEPVSHAVIAGALFDFMGWLTTRKERLVLSSVDNASPAADAIKAFAKMRGLSLDDARVGTWQNYTTPPQRQWVGLEIEEVQDSYNSDYQAQTRAVEKLLKEKNNGY